MASQFRAVLFDLDGVLADSHPVHEAAWRELLAEAGKDGAKCDIARIIRQGKTRSEIIRMIFPGLSDSEEKALGSRKDELYRKHMQGLQPIAGALTWLGQLHARSVPLAVATSASRLRATDTLHRFGIEGYFRAVVTGSDVARGKPDPALFLQAAGALSTGAANTLVVEDSPDGLRAAKSAGMGTLLYAPDSDPELLALTPDYVVTEFSERSLAPVMRQIRDGRETQAP